MLFTIDGKPVIPDLAINSADADTRYEAALDKMLKGWDWNAGFESLDEDLQKKFHETGNYLKLRLSEAIKPIAEILHLKFDTVLQTATVLDVPSIVDRLMSSGLSTKSIAFDGLTQKIIPNLCGEAIKLYLIARSEDWVEVHPGQSYVRRPLFESIKPFLTQVSRLNNAMNIALEQHRVEFDESLEVLRSNAIEIDTVNEHASAIASVLDTLLSNVANSVQLCNKMAFHNKKIDDANAFSKILARTIVDYRFAEGALENALHRFSTAIERRKNLSNFLIFSPVSSETKVFLRRASNLYLNGFDPECVVFCYAAIESQLENCLKPADWEERFGKIPLRNLSNAERFEIAGMSGRLDSKLSSFCEDLRKARNRIMHDDGLTDADSYATLLWTSKVLDCLEVR